MVIRLKKALLCCGWVVMLLTLTACTAEELVSEVPETVQLRLEDIEENLNKEQKTPETVNESTSLPGDMYRYAYDILSEEKKLWYQDMVRALEGMQDEVRLSDDGLEAGLEEGCIDEIFQCVLNDHPELFYVNGYTYTKFCRGDKLVAISFSGSYELSPEEVEKRKLEIEEAASKVLAGISEDASEYDKVKYVYETIIRNTDYDLNAPDNQNIYSVFVNKRSVCQGYAKAVQYLLNRLGMDCTLVQGTVDTGEGHAWNLVKVDGSFYYLDATWGDASYQMDSAELEEQKLPEVNYDYFCITTEQILATHSFENCVPLPECTDQAANYYVRQGALFATYDREQMEALFEKAYENGNNDVTVKCADEDCFLEIKTELIDNQGIFDYLQDRDSRVAYASNDKQLSLTFWMTNQ